MAIFLCLLSVLGCYVYLETNIRCSRTVRQATGQWRFVTPRWKNHRHHSYLWYSRNANTLLLGIVVVVANGQKWISMFIFISFALESYLRSKSVLWNERIIWISNKRYSKLCLNRTKSGQGSLRCVCLCVCVRAFLFIFFLTEITNRVGFLIESTRRKIVTKAFSNCCRLIAAGLHGLY